MISFLYKRVFLAKWFFFPRNLNALLFLGLLPGWKLRHTHSNLLARKKRGGIAGFYRCSNQCTSRAIFFFFLSFFLPFSFPLGSSCKQGRRWNCVIQIMSWLVACPELLPLGFCTCWIRSRLVVPPMSSSRRTILTVFVNLISVNYKTYSI